MDLASWGLVTEAELARLVVVSPHLDDAVLGASGVLAAAPAPTVVTLYAGAPDPAPDPPTPWDALGGFGPGDDVVACRREEDRAGLAELGATPRWLDLLDHQYRDEAARVPPAAVADVLEPVLRDLEPTAMLVPFGLANPDHEDAHEAALLVRERMPEPAWLCYEDTGYKHVPGLLAWRIARLFGAGLWPTPAAPPVDADPGLRWRSFAHYLSQVRALDAEWGIAAKLDAPAPEQCWRLAPPPPGWEGLAAR